MNNKRKYILTISCKDRSGIVAAVSGFLANNDSNIIELQQFSDSSTQHFFMRVEFETSYLTSASLNEKFSDVSSNFGMDVKIYNVDYKQKIMIAVSKTDHCLNHILHKYNTGFLPIEIVGVVSNHNELSKLVQPHNIPFYHLPINKDSKQSQEKEFFDLFTELKADTLVLARYMQVLSDDFCSKIQGKAINIHHSFLPGFKGANPYKQAYDRGVKIIGATAHYVTAQLDEGPIIEQEIIRVNHSKTSHDLKNIGQDIESQVLTRALKYHIEQRIMINDQKTVIFN